MKVAKFGGSSVASAEMLKKVANIIKADETRKFIVVSAPGKRFEGDHKVTDLFIQLLKQLKDGVDYQDTLNKVVNRFRMITEELSLPNDIPNDLEKKIEKLFLMKKSHEQLVDELKSFGEDTLARILSDYLSELGIQSTYRNPKEAGIIVSDDYGNAAILDEAYEQIHQLRNEHGVIVIPGFFGYTKNGQLRTFPRGGSDITGSIIAAGVEADLYENFTDVSSVYCVNPKLVPQPKEITMLTYKEMRELSYSGFSVFHDEALIPAFKKKIPVVVKNTNHPDLPGTMIKAEKEDFSKPVVGIASDEGFSSIYVRKYLMNRELGFGLRLLKILVDENISFEHAPSGIDDMSVIVRTHQLTKEKEDKVLKRIQTELDVDTISIQHNLAMIMLVGEGMSQRINVAAKATKAIAEATTNIEMINQGSSEVSMMFGIESDKLQQTVQSLYREFFEQSTSS
uniref:aspartate kinase n=1 Tax=uncultured Allobacillus sp. TaxID=1638025 RepID=UPI002591CC94|nr:aspartate kinase [uncultured Allobacillus sp.]